MQNINIKLNPDDLLDISSQVPIKTGIAQQVTNVSDVLTGPQGPKGDTGDTGPAGPRGPKGDTGDTGPAGPAGSSATIAVGTVTTLPAGSNATVTNSGTSSSAVLDFGIPPGDKGETGATGPQGETGATGQSANISIGTVTTLPSGSNATVTNSGTSMDAVLDFGIPQGPKGDTGEVGPRGQKGDTGDTGPIGPAGSSATIAVGTVSTLPAGSNATVTNSGTSSSAVLDFGIPQGESGTVSYSVVKDFIDRYLQQEMPKCYAYTDTKMTSAGRVSYNHFIMNEGDFTFSSGRILVPKAGYYKVSARISGYGTNGWLFIYAYEFGSSHSPQNIVASAINRIPSATYHSVVIDSAIVYLSDNGVIEVRQNDDSFSVNDGMDAGVKATTLTLEYIGTAAN